MKQQNFHEMLIEEVAGLGPTNRSFGLTVGIILVCIGVIRSYLHNLIMLDVVVISIGILLVFSALLSPSLLTMVNKSWIKIGNILFKCMNPILMFILYFFCFMPIGFILKIFRYDPLKVTINKYQATYWEVKPKNELETPMKYQF